MTVPSRGTATSGPHLARYTDQRFAAADVHRRDGEQCLSIPFPRARHRCWYIHTLHVHWWCPPWWPAAGLAEVVFADDEAKG